MASSSSKSLCDVLWDKFPTGSVRILHAPLVIGIASGTLSTYSFRDFLYQEVYLLNFFTEMYKKYQSQTGLNDSAKISVKMLIQKVSSNAEFLRKLACGSKRDYQVNPRTIQYTNFILSIATTNPTKAAKLTLVAMIAHLQIHAFIGRSTLTILHRRHYYKKWIQYCNSDCSEVEVFHSNWVHSLCGCPSEEEMGIMQELYHQALTHELALFSVQFQQNFISPLSSFDLSRTHITIVSEFDYTCAIEDSAFTLAANSQTPYVSKSMVCLRNKYNEDYQKCIEEIMQSDKVEKFNYIALEEALGPLSAFEKKANRKVIKSGVLEGLRLDALNLAGEDLALHEGCMDFFRSLNNKNNENLTSTSYILSSSWCDDLIKSTFRSGDVMVNVFANELLYEQSVCTGKFLKRVETPFEKAERLHIIKHKEVNKNSTLVIYVGCSVRDILCLLQADIGIVMGFDKNLRLVGEHFGVKFLPLFNGLVNRQKQVARGINLSWRKMRGVLYTVATWAEIHALVIGS